MKKSQISFEYVIIMGFVVLSIMGILAVAFYYSDSVKDQVKTSQIDSCINKIVSTSESIFYAGKPSKATIQCYLPDNVVSIQISAKELYVSYQSSNSVAQQSYTSNVPLTLKTFGPPGPPIGSGLKTIVVTAGDTAVDISIT